MHHQKPSCSTCVHVVKDKDGVMYCKAGMVYSLPVVTDKDYCHLWQTKDGTSFNDYVEGRS